MSNDLQDRYDHLKQRMAVLEDRKKNLEKELDDNTKALLKRCGKFQRSEDIKTLIERLKTDLAEALKRFNKLESEVDDVLTSVEKLD